MRGVWAILLVALAIVIFAYGRPHTSDRAREPLTPAVQTLDRATATSSTRTPNADMQSEAASVQTIKQLTGDAQRSIDLKKASTLGPGARLWVGWWLLYCVAEVDSPPSSVRLSGETMPIRFRELWSSPVGLPPDPDFLVELHTFWRKRMLNVIARRTDQLCLELSALRAKMLRDLPEADADVAAARLTEADKTLEAEWRDFVSLCNSPNTKTDSDPAASAPMLACVTLRIKRKDVRIALTNMGPKAKELDLEAWAAWTKLLQKTADDLNSLSKSTEETALIQLGEK